MLAAIAVLAAHSSPNAQQTLNIGLYANEPKLFRDDDGEPAGFWPELVAAVAEELSIEPRFIDCNLSQCLDMLEAGELDIMSDVAFSEERDRRFLFGSHTVLYSWSEILVPRGSTITNINDLDGRTIAVVDGSIAYDELRSMVATGTIGATILPVREASDGPPMVERGEVDAVVLNRLYASRVAESSTLIKLNRPFVLTQLLFAYPPGTPSELIEAVDQAVYRQQSERGSAYIQAKRRWIDGESYAIPDWLLPVLIALAAISATAGFSTMLMRRTVQRRTAALREVVGRLEEELVARKRAEAAAAALQKAEALGRLVGGIAHDFNNHLAVILGNLERLRQRVTDHEALEELRDALAAAERGSKLTRQLLASGRRAALQPRTIDMNRVVADMHGLLRRTLPAMIALETRLTPDLRPIEVDLAQLESALLNLVINARDAMPKGGNITIGTESILLDERLAEQLGLELSPGGYSALWIADTGVGMDEKAQAQIFEPFFTTKQPGEGTGMGLAIVQGFVTQSGGGIGLRSALNAGATFTLYFPSVDGPVHEDTLRSDAVAIKPGREDGEHVLLVEDNPEVRQTLRRQLESLGYKTTAAPDGQSALSVVEFDPSIEIVLSDVVMPGAIQGTNLAALLRESHPNLPVLLMSGNAAVLPGGLGNTPAEAVIQKPTPSDVLGRAIREALDRKGRAPST